MPDWKRKETVTISRLYSKQSCQLVLDTERSMMNNGCDKKRIVSIQSHDVSVAKTPSKDIPVQGS